MVLLFADSLLTWNKMHSRLCDSLKLWYGHMTKDCNMRLLGIYQGYIICVWFLLKVIPKTFLQFEVFYDYVNSLLMHFNICTWFVSGGYNVGCSGCLSIRYFPYLDNVTLWYTNKKKSTIILYKNYYWTECCFSFVQEKCFMHIIMVHYNVYIF